IAALLAAMKAGATYVPLVPSLPERRLNYILRDAGVEHVIADESGFERLRSHRRNPTAAEVESELTEVAGIAQIRFGTRARSSRGAERHVGAVVSEEGETFSERDVAIRTASEYSAGLVPEQLVEVEAADLVESDEQSARVSPEVLESDAEAADSAIERRTSASEPAPVSPDQRRLWLLQRVEPDDVAYVVPEIARLEGEIDLEALEQATRELVGRHQILASRFPGSRDGPLQERVDVEEAFDWEVLDLRDDPGAEARAEAILEDRKTRPFDLTEQTPVRFTVIRMGDRETIFAAIFHHIATDEWASRTFWRELEELYLAGRDGRQSELEELSVQYADYAAWRQRGSDGSGSGVGFWKQKLTGAQGLDFWEQYLEGARADVDWPSETPPTGDQAGPAEHVEFEWEGELGEALDKWARRHGVSRFFALYTAFVSFLANYTGQRDLTIGVPFTNRRRPELEPLMGFFLNVLPVRAQWRPGESYVGFARRLWADWRQVASRRDVSLDRIVNELDVSDRTGASPLFDVIITVVPEHALDGEFG
ncbi:MAG: condensation domain-containing protein, partial [Bradymonadaceae bacterium]